MTIEDQRFDISAWSYEAGPSRASQSEDEAGSETSQDSQGEGGVDPDEEEHDEGNDESAPLVKPLSKDELQAFEKKHKKRGIIYISRIPPGMTPPKVRHLLSNFGEVERIYLQDGRKKQREAETGIKKQNTRRNTTFTEGWVEFGKKSVAKIIAYTLNAQPIGFVSGGRKANKNAKRWKDDVWTMKYLPGFKWHMLSEQMAHERAAHTSRLRTELSQSKMEQADYLKKVERARIQRQKEERRKQRAVTAATDGSPSKAQCNSSLEDRLSTETQRVRTFQQRQPVLRDVRDRESRHGGGEGSGKLKRPSSSSSLLTQSKKKKSDSEGRSTRPTSCDGGGDAMQSVLGKIL